MRGHFSSKHGELAIDAEIFLAPSSIFSNSVKIAGKRAYSYARKGNKIELKSRVVTIKVFEILQVNLPEIKFKVCCSKGTYIRSLVHDFGKELGTGAYLASLSRTAIGEYKLNDALEVSEICEDETLRRN